MIRILIAALFITCVTLPVLAGDQVVKDAGKTYIPGLERLEWGKGRDCSYIGALTALAHKLGDDVSYDYLMGVSGMAFKVHKWADGWSLGAGCAGPGFDVTGTAKKALGYKMKFYGWYEGKGMAEAMAVMREPIIQSIDKGFPVMVLCEDDGLIAGYTDEGDKLICRTYFDKDGEYSELKDTPWCISVLESRGKPAERKTAVRKSLKIVAEIWATKKYGDFYSGKTAYGEWIKELENEKAFSDAKDVEKAIHANRFCYMVLADGRSAAARYLRSIQDDLGPKSKPHVLKAADLYEKAAKKLDDGRGYVPVEWEQKPWTQDMRKAQATVLKDVSKLEEKAVVELRAALSAH